MARREGESISDEVGSRRVSLAGVPALSRESRAGGNTLMPTAVELIAKFRNNVLASLDEAVSSISAAVRSPIEEILVWDLIDYAGHESVLGCRGLPTQSLPGASGHEAFCITLDRGELEATALWIQPEIVAEGRRYRLDIGLEVIQGNCRALVAIECDGHDFHEKTKKQAQHDKRRDRDLQILGWSVARFTGSEIVRDPRAASRSSYRLAHSIINARQLELIQAIERRREGGRD